MIIIAKYQWELLDLSTDSYETMYKRELLINESLN